MTSILWGLALPFLKHTWTYILVIVIAFVAWNRFQNWMQYSPKPQRIKTRTVSSVESPNLIIVKKGLIGRRREGLALWGIEIPSEQTDDAYEQMNNLISVGDQITVEKKGSYYKIINGGQYVNKELILAGNAKLNQDDEELLSAQNEARDNKLGMWHDYKKPFFPFWRQTEEKLLLELEIK